MVYDLLKQNALSNRMHPTDAEAFLWLNIKGRQTGYRFRRQYVVGEYIVDFVCLKAMLVVEVDGGYHMEPSQKIIDDVRTDYLRSQGFEVVRFSNEDVMYNIENVLKKIGKMVEERTASIKCAQPAPPLSEGAGGRLGKVLIVCAPSGTGKSTIIQYLQSVMNDSGAQESPSLGGVRGGLYFSVSATTRAPRGEEKNGVEYFFLTEEEFQQKIEEDAFIEWEQVYAGQKYGTLKEQVEGQLAAGRNIVFDVDVNGGLRIKDYFKDRALSLFILPPSIEALRERLEKRGTETPEKIQKRIDRAEYEISRAPEFDRRIVNDDLATAEAEALEMVSEFLR
ncbi:MAG: guanylate kinase [Bacteroidaceae bacterium]|nr:guanylate kinase [Bacteroidaceae bacterium]